MDLEGFDLNLIVAFDALMTERNVTRAAHRIGLTQPAMSAALARLRKATGDELFVRGPTGLAPTPRAQDLIGPLRLAISTVSDSLDLDIQFDPQMATQTFTVALSDHPAQRLLPGLASIIAREAPGVNLRALGFQHRRDAIRLLDEGIVDAAIGVSPGTERRIFTTPLFSERFICIARRDSPVIAALSSVEAFAAAPHILVSPEGDEHGVVDDALDAAGLTRRLCVVLPHMYAVPALVVKTDMIATLMEGVVMNSGFSSHLHIASPPMELPSVEFHLLWHRRTEKHPGYRWFRSCVVEAAKVP